MCVFPRSLALACAPGLRRKAGEALHPRARIARNARADRRAIGEWNFAGQYQQTPAPAGGGMIKAAWLRLYHHHELSRAPGRGRRVRPIVQSWDTANAPSELSDYSVCATWELKGADFYLLNDRLLGRSVAGGRLPSPSGRRWPREARPDEGRERASLWHSGAREDRGQHALAVFASPRGLKNRSTVQPWRVR